MDIKSIIAISFVCAMGAISPGPSLAIVIRNTISGGRIQGVMTGLGHGLGLSIYALIAVMGLSSLILNNHKVFNTLQSVGALILLWFGYLMITSKTKTNIKPEKKNYSRGFYEGFMIAFLNPKILVYFVAVFSQFINPNLEFIDRVIMAIIAGVIDTAWYVTVATIFAKTTFIDSINKKKVYIDRLIGIVLIVLALFLILKTTDYNVVM